jgi:hypothetical protein
MVALFRHGSVYPSAMKGLVTRAGILVYLLPFMVAGCGKSSTTSFTTTPAPTASPTAACAQDTVIAGTVPIPVQAVLFTELKLTAAAHLTATLDWTRSLSTMRLAIVTGDCNGDDFKANTCLKLLDASAPPKPATGSADLPAGTYSVAIQNQSNFRDTVTYSVVRASVGCPAP